MKPLLAIALAAVVSALTMTAPAAAWNDGTAYVIVKKKQHCVGAFAATGGISRYEFYEVRGMGGKLIDAEKRYGEAYVNCSLPRGRYYKIQVTAFYLDDDLNRDYYESRWVRFKIPK